MRVLLLAIPLLPLQNVIWKIDQPMLGLPGINFQNLLLLFLLLLWLSRTMAKGKPVFPRSRFNRILLAFAFLSYLGLWRAATYVGRDFPISPAEPNFVYWKDYMTQFVLFWVMNALLDDERSARRQTAAMFMFLPYMMFVHRNHLQWASSWHYDHDLRVRGTMMHLGSNELAAFYSIGLMVVVGLLMHMKHWKWRLYLWGAFGLLIWGVVNSYSRSSYVACIAGAVLVGVYRNRKLVLLLGVFALVAPWVLPDSVKERFGMIGEDQTKTDESTMRRIELWDVAKRRWAENPILGTGLRSFRHLNKWKMDTHNMYYKLLCELGIFGILLYVLQFIVGFRQAAALNKVATTPFLKGLSLGLMAACVAGALLNIFGDRSSHLAVTSYWWVWHGMASRGLRAIEDGEDWGLQPADTEAAT